MRFANKDRKKKYAHSKLDDHFLPQYHFCNLWKYSDHFQSVTYRSTNLRAKALNFLDSIGERDLFFNWRGSSTEELFPERSEALHITNSSSKMMEYYDAEVAQLL